MGNQFSAYGKTLHDVEKNDPHLSELDFAGTSLTDSKVRRLSERIHNNTYVQKLHATWNIALWVHSGHTLT